VTGGGAGNGTQARLAELVAALSLGVDLGFGQPMEHVLRECLIALRLAERLGLDDGERVVVYYTALLVNVGCHSDAHEQAKWFGDDIVLKGAKYEHQQRSLAFAAATMRMFGSGNPPLHRFRLGLEFALAGHRDIDGMIARHSALARSLAGQLGLPEDAAAELRAEVTAGRLDSEAVEAVLAAAGHRAIRRREGPAGLTAREVDVLRLLARGLSSTEIAARLVISPKTVRNHIEHIYTKIGASSRATASLFAMRHGLLSDDYLFAT
jgi:DNA-binding CsgD family transcriptional regulator